MPTPLRECVIDLPLPPGELRANSGLTPLRKSQFIAKAREDAKKKAGDLLARKRAAPPLWRCVNISCHFRWESRRRAQDLDNATASIKAYLDGLKQYVAHAKTIKRTGIVIPAIEGAGILADDRYIMDLHMTWSIDKKNPGVTITIIPIAEERAA